MTVKMTEMTVPTSQITGNFLDRGSVNTEADAELVANIKANKGNIKPVLLRIVEGDKYEVVAGTRVVPAVKAAGFPTVLARVSEMTDLEATELRLADTVFNVELSRLDVAHLLMKMVNSGVKQSKIGARLGKSPSWVSRTLELLEIPVATQKAIQEGDITPEAALILEKVPNAKQREVLTAKVKDGGMSVTETLRTVDKSLDKIDNDSKIEALKSTIQEYNDKITSAIESKQLIATHEQRLAELTNQRATLSATIDDDGIKQKAFALEIIESKIKPLEGVIATIDAEIKAMTEDCSKVNVELTSKQVTSLVVKQDKAAKTVEKAKAALETAIADHKSISDKIRPLSAGLKSVETLKKTIGSKKTTRLAKKSNLDELIKAHKGTYEQYDEIRAEVDSHSDSAEAVMNITVEYTEISQQLPSLRGRANNLSKWQEILARNENELAKMEQLAK